MNLDGSMDGYLHIFELLKQGAVMKKDKNTRQIYITVNDRNYKINMNLYTNMFFNEICIIYEDEGIQHKKIDPLKIECYVEACIQNIDKYSLEYLELLQEKLYLKIREKYPDKEQKLDKIYQKLKKGGV